MKRCPKCKSDKDESLFSKSSRTKDGLQTWCKSCASKARMKTYYKDPSVNRRAMKRMIARNREYVDSILLKSECKDCGYNENIRALQFDHIRDKLINVSEMIHKGMSIEKIQNEIDKCEIRCANCHLIITHERRMKKK